MSRVQYTTFRVEKWGCSMYKNNVATSLRLAEQGKLCLLTLPFGSPTWTLQISVGGGVEEAVLDVWVGGGGCAVDEVMVSLLPPPSFFSSDPHTHWLYTQNFMAHFLSSVICLMTSCLALMSAAFFPLFSNNLLSLWFHTSPSPSHSPHSNTTFSEKVNGRIIYCTRFCPRWSEWWLL